MTEDIDKKEKQEPIPLDHGVASRLDIPEGVYECILTNITEIAKMNKLRRTTDHGAMFTFEIIEGPYKGKIFVNFFTNKLTKRSKLTVLCRAIWGDDFQPEEIVELKMVNDLKRFLLNKPFRAVLLLRHTLLTDSFWYDVAYFIKSEHYDTSIAKTILPVEQSE